MSLSKKTFKGFTLIELLTVIAIIGILASIVVVAVNEPRKRSRDAKRISDLKSIKTASEMYYEQNQSFPMPNYNNCSTYPMQNSNWAESNCPQEWDQCDMATGTCLQKYLASYLNPLPKDPLNGKTGVQVVTSNCSKINFTGPMVYFYRAPAGGQSFKARSYLETMCDGNSDGGNSPTNYEVWGGDGGQAL